MWLLTQEIWCLVPLLLAAHGHKAKYGLNQSVFKILYREYKDVFDFDVPPNDPTIHQQQNWRLTSWSLIQT